MVELELLGVTWAMKKCRLYLSGQPDFEVLVDHRPLVSILDQQTLDEVENPRIQRLKERTLGYIFHTVWRKGKEHQIADALSRAPVSEPSQEDRDDEDQLRYGSAMVRVIAAHRDAGAKEPEHLQDPNLQRMQAMANDDEDYQEIIKAIEKGFPKKPTTPNLQSFFKLKDELQVEDSLILFQGRLVVPKAGRRKMLEDLHAAHQGIDRTKKRARQTVFWPGITSDITSTVEACYACQESRPSLPREPLKMEEPPMRPGQDGSADIFSAAGKKFLAYCDRFSGWPMVAQWNSDPTARQVIGALQDEFAAIGIPVRIRSDGGPQFKAKEFQDFLKDWGIQWAPSSVENPSSNGHAEAAVKAMKALVQKTGGNIASEKFRRGLLEWRNTPNATGKSPAQVMFGRPLRGFLPVHPSILDGQEDFSDHRQTKKVLKETAKTQHDKTAHELPALKPGDRVLVQDTTTSQWSKRATVTGIRRNGLYNLKMENGNISHCNRRLLRLDKTKARENGTRDKMKVKISDEVNVKEIPPRNTAPPRAQSTRKKKIPNRYLD